MTERVYSAEILSRGKEDVVEGETWIFKEGVEATYPPGKIYVSPYIDLSQAYVALQNAKAVIVTEGGLLSHLAVLGREYGITVVRVDDPSILDIGNGRRVRICVRDKPTVEVVE